MTTFQYIARDSGGAEVSGAMQADSEEAVVRTLRERSLYPVRVDTRADRAVRSSLPFAGNKVRGRDLTLIYGQLADLLHSGVPLLRSLEILTHSATRKPVADSLRKLHDAVAEGSNLADAMTAQEQTFSSLHVAMVRAGERAGFLEEVFANLSGFLERQDELRSKVIGSLIYPLLLTVIGAMAIVFVLVWLVPQFKPFFKDPGTLPTITLLLFAASDVLAVYWPMLLGVGVLAVSGGVWLRRQDAVREAASRWMLRVPVLGGVLASVSIARFCRILGTMLQNGVPILQALQIARDAAGNRVLAETVGRATESVRAGEPLADPLREGAIFPPEVVEMIAVAEESNQMEKVLVQIADTVERRTNRKVDFAVRLVEPLILVMMAGVIGMVAAGLLYPIFTMASQL
jgi:general secretion pathway protein F/type IV pilus assembly protein PilC